MRIRKAPDSTRLSLLLSQVESTIQKKTFLNLFKTTRPNFFCGPVVLESICYLSYESKTTDK